MPKITSNKLLGKVVGFANRVAGVEARTFKNQAKVLAEAKNLGRLGVPASTIQRAARMSHVSSGRSFQTRVKAGLGTTAGVTAGFLGLHKYHQHRDNKILERIDNMYKKS
jgi:hypothetical protein